MQTDVRWQDVVDLLRFMTTVVVAGDNVGSTAMVFLEGVCGCEQVSHDEALGQSLFFKTMCNC